MSGFFIDDEPRVGAFLFGGANVTWHLDARGELKAHFGSQLQALAAIKAHVDQVRNIGINTTPTPMPSVETKTEAPNGHMPRLPGPAQRKPAAAVAAPAKTKPAPAPQTVLGGPASAAPVKRGRGRPPKAKPADAE